MHAKISYGFEFFGALDAFGNHLRAVVVRELHHRLDEILLDEVRIDTVDQRDVELDEVRLEVGNRAQSGVAAAGIVDRESEPNLAKGAEALAKLWVILDCRPLGDLDDHAVRVLYLSLVERGIA